MGPDPHEPDVPDERDPGAQALDGLEASFEGGDRLYRDLRGLAARALDHHAGAPTLQPTALVHEVWLRFAAGDERRWANREHFLASAALTMRRILSNHARARRAEKRGGAAARVELDEALAPIADQGIDLVALDEALDDLASHSPRAARVVCLRFFGGLTHAEIANLLELSERSIERQWRLARAWLEDRLGEPR